MRERIHAPDFSFVRGWLNVDRPLSLRELRGQVVVLDFWTYCCVNCMHVLPVLRDLEERHRADPLAVIGVHSGKFDAERDARRIGAAMERYGVRHPVAVDEDMEVWSRYAIRSWPTLVVIRPDGTLAAVAPGEPDPEVLEAFVAQQLAEGRANGTLSREPLRLLRAGPVADAAAPLRFPGKAVAAPDGRIAVADSGHHRVLLLDADGRCLDCIGSGLRGAREGGFADAALDDPQGLAFDGDALYVADARAHVVWRADLRARTLARAAGTFELGRAPLSGRSEALQAALRSPWDLALHGRRLFVALAGSHQLAALDLARGAIEPVAGTGREALEDGPAREAALAQPSGLSLRGRTLYVADSESSAVRALDLETGRIGTLAGGPGLFDFGDRTGPVGPGMMQHPLAVLATDGGVVVADTYNDKLKRFSPDGLQLSPFAAGAGALSQPAGLALLPGGEVLVADTNHHRLVALSADGSACRVLEVRGAPAWKPGEAAPLAPPRASPAAAAGWFTALIEAPPGQGLASGAVRIALEVRAPEGYELSQGAPWSAQLEVSRRSDLLRLSADELRGEAEGGPVLRLAVEATATHAADVDSELLVSLRAVACDAVDHAACVPVRNMFRVPLRLLQAGQREVRHALPLDVKR